MLIWLVASRHKNRIPNDAKYITQAIHCTTKLQLKELIASGWLYYADDAPLAEDKHNASKLLAERSKNAIPEKEREVEEETELETTTAFNNDRSALVAKLPEAYRPDLESFLKSLGTVTAQYSWIRSIEAKLDGMHPPQASPELIGKAIRELNGNNEKPNWRRFEGYLREPAPVLAIARAPHDATAEGLLIVGELRSKRVHHRAPESGAAGVYVIPRSEIEGKSEAVRRVVDAIGGLGKIANLPDDKFSILAAQFASMYVAALNKAHEAQVA